MRQGLIAIGVAATLLADTGWAADRPVRACDINLDVADPDPAGLNVRATPGGVVINALKPKGEWLQVHVVGASGAWAAIEDATLYTEDHAEGRQVFRGRGFVAFSKLAISELDEHARILIAPSDSARVLRSFTQPDEAKPPTAKVLDCDGFFLKVRVSGVVGWTRDFCSNEFTTCS